MNWRSCYSTIAILLAAVVGWAFFQFWYPYHFFYQEQNQIFLWSWDYVEGYFERPGGLARLVGDFLTQFYYYLFAGAAILAACLLAVGGLVYRIIRNIWNIRNIQKDRDIQNARDIRASRAIATAGAIAAMGFVAACHFSVSYRLSSTIAIIGWLGMIVITGTVLLIRCPGGRIRRTVPVIILACLLLPTAWLLFGKPDIKTLKGPDMILEKNFAVDNEYYFGNYDRVVDIVRSSDGWNNQMLFFYNLVMAQRGELADHLLDFTPNYLGTFEKIGPETPRLTIINQNELYWLLGDMTFTERAAMMTNVFAPDNRNVRMMRRLAECNLVSGDSLAAEKYLRILDKTLVYRPWAQRLRQHGREIYAQKMRLVNRRDTITITDNAHFLMMQLLDAHPDNQPALDYILCSTLLLKDIENFKRDYDRYCLSDSPGSPVNGGSSAVPAPPGTDSPGPDRDVLLHRIHTTKLYQEALCIWLAGSDAPQELWQRYIHREDVMKQFVEYNRERGNPRFRGTYWYYFDTFKGKVISE